MTEIESLSSDSHPSVKVAGTDGKKSAKSYGMGIIMPVLFFQQAVGAVAFPVTRYGVGIIEPFAFAFFRFVISAVLLMLIVSLKQHAIPVERKDYLRIIGLGVLIIPFNQVAYLFGQSLTTAGHGSLLFATTPIWIFIAAIIHLKERIIIRRGIGIVIAVAGVIVIMSAGALRLGTDNLFGDLIILLAVFAWAYYTILGKPLVRKYGAFRVTAYALTSGSVLYFPFGLYAASRVDYAGVTIGGWLAVLYMAIGTSIVAYVLWYWALKHMEASRIAVFHNLQPVIATAVAYFWLGEPVGTAFVIGGLTVLGGVLIAEL